MCTLLSQHGPCSHSAARALRRENDLCLHSRYLPQEFTDQICVFLHDHLCHVAFRKSSKLSPEKTFGNGFEEASGNVCAELSDGFVSIMAAFLAPRAMKEYQ